MAMIRLTLIGEHYGCIGPLVDAHMRTSGFELVFTRSPSPEAMRRQLRHWEFDMCEMAFGAYLIAREQGADVTAIPVFPRRAFFHVQSLYHADSGITGPRDLNGRRVGFPEYVQSASLWARGVLQRDFGMDPHTIAWYMERVGDGNTGEVLGFRPPSDVRIQQTPGGKSLIAMLSAKELDAALVVRPPEQSTQDAAKLRPLFPDPIAEGQRYYATHGFVPANHTYMIRASLAREHPQIVANLYRAFVDAVRQAEADLGAGAHKATLFGNESLARTSASFDGDAFAYGIEPNRAMLTTVIALCREQGLIRAAPTVEEIFARCE
jgi:4,5-dihydroxyphthalate decarboxylase